VHSKAFASVWWGVSGSRAIFGSRSTGEVKAAPDSLSPLAQVATNRSEVDTSDSKDASGSSCGSGGGSGGITSGDLFVEVDDSTPQGRLLLAVAAWHDLWRGLSTGTTAFTELETLVGPLLEAEQGVESLSSTAFAAHRHVHEVFLVSFSFSFFSPCPPLSQCLDNSLRIRRVASFFIYRSIFFFFSLLGKALRTRGTLPAAGFIYPTGAVDAAWCLLQRRSLGRFETLLRVKADMSTIGRSLGALRLLVGHNSFGLDSLRQMEIFFLPLNLP